jgi:hypothetical protein
MKIQIRQTITNTLSEARELLKSAKTEMTILSPDEGKSLKSLKTGKISNGAVCLSAKEKPTDFIEIDN